MKKSKEVVDSGQKDKVQTVMYIGPTIIGVLKQYSVYNNGIPESVLSLSKDVPAVKYLIVPIDAITESKKQINESGSALNVMYNKVLSYVKQGGK